MQHTHTFTFEKYLKQYAYAEYIQEYESSNIIKITRQKADI